MAIEVVGVRKTVSPPLQRSREGAEDYRKKTVVVCDTQPITAEGLRHLLAQSPHLAFLESLSSLEAITALIGASRAPDLLVVDKGFGMRVVLDWIHDLKRADTTPLVIVWGISMTEAEVSQLLRAGVRGIVRKAADSASLLACLSAVASGGTWLDYVFRDLVQSDRRPPSALTPREQQVLDLVEQSFTNQDIALELGISPSTVKVHLHHIFKKTGVRGRYGLTINGLSENCIDRVLRSVGEAEQGTRRLPEFRLSNVLIATGVGVQALAGESLGSANRFESQTPSAKLPRQ